MEYRRRTGGRDQNGEGASLRRIPIESKSHSSVKKDPKKRRRQGTSGGVVCAEEGDSARKPQKRRNTAAAVFRCAALPVLICCKAGSGRVCAGRRQIKRAWKSIRRLRRHRQERRKSGFRGNGKAGVIKRNGFAVFLIGNTIFPFESIQHFLQKFLGDAQMFGDVIGSIAGNQINLE